MLGDFLDKLLYLLVLFGIFILGYISGPVIGSWLF